MKTYSLTPCQQCARHVRSSEPACPFCGAELKAEARATTPGPLTRGVSRAAAFAVRAALVTATAACAASHDDDEPGSGSDASADAAQTGDAQAGDAQAGLDAAAEADAQGAAPQADAGAALDAEPDADWVPIPIYGGVFPDPRTRARV